MTLEWLRKQIWQKTQQPTDLNPDTDTQYTGGKPLLNYVVNEAQRVVAMWVDRKTGQRIRIRDLISDLFFQAKVITGTLLANAPADNKLTLPAADIEDNDDRYNSWILEVSGEQAMVVDYASYVCTVHKDWGTNPVLGETYKLYKNFFFVTTVGDPWSADHIEVPAQSTRYRGQGNLLEPLKIRHPEQGRTLKRVSEKFDFMSYLWTKGDPTQWNQVGKKIFFNRQLDEDDWYQLFYYRTPTELTLNADEQEIPEIFVPAMINWGTRWVLKRDGESSQAYSTKIDFHDLMRSIKSQYDLSYELEDDWGSLQIN